MKPVGIPSLSSCSSSHSLRLDQKFQQAPGDCTTCASLVKEALGSILGQVLYILDYFFFEFNRNCLQLYKLP